MKEKVWNTIKKYNLIVPGDKIVLGVSGGPDSLCLLYLLDEIRHEKHDVLPFDIVVAHVNHQIREEAKSDEEFVRKTCENLGVKFFSKSIDVLNLAHTKKIGTEEAGRQVRYDFFDEVMTKTNSSKIAIAHNKNDKVETMIMNVLRGSGITGLRGIEPIKDNKYIRPLLECERSEIEEYCIKKELEPRIDTTNFDNTYTRNKIRNVVIPYVKEEFNPNFIHTMNRLSELIIEEDDFMQKQVETIYFQIFCREDFPNQIILDLKKFNLQEMVIKSRLIRYTIMRLLGNVQGIGKVHIDDLITLCQNNIGNKYLTPNKNLKVLVKNGQIYFIKQK